MLNFIYACHSLLYYLLVYSSTRPCTGLGRLQEETAAKRRFLFCLVVVVGVILSHYSGASLHRSLLAARYREKLRMRFPVVSIRSPIYSCLPLPAIEAEGVQTFQVQRLLMLLRATSLPVPGRPGLPARAAPGVDCKSIHTNVNAFGLVCFAQMVWLMAAAVFHWASGIGAGSDNSNHGFC